MTSRAAALSTSPAVTQICGEEYHDDFRVPLFLGLVIGLLLTSCISCLVLYGFGEAIENMHAIKWKIDNHDFTDEKERFERVKNALSK